MSKLSIVIPVYNEGEPLKVLCRRIIDSIPADFNSYEIVMVDDRSRDSSWLVMKELAAANSNIKVARLVRNFGQHSALTAGIELATGDYIVMMDCDQQDEPENIERLYNELKKQDVHIVYAMREQREDSFFKKKSSVLINYLLEKLSGYQHDPRIGTYRIFSRTVRDSYLMMPEKRRYLGGMFFWMGFESANVDVKHKERQHGKSNYTFSKQLKLAKLAILSSSTKLLSLGIYLGVFSSIVSCLLVVYFAYMKFRYDVPLGYSSIIVSIFLSTGLILLFLGLIGEYLSEIYHEIKGRPNYIIEETIN